MTSSVLLDTCAALWTVDDSIPEPAADVLSTAYRAGIPTYVSPVTAWEIGAMARKGRFRATCSPQAWFERLMAVPTMRLAPLTPEILLASCFLPGILSCDPADRIIAATARECGFILMTYDRGLLDYAAEGHLRVVEC
ncbi:MAG: type II toxin-antitoxin system VapC family toxin [Alphaproteobacteria bacterium]|nr:type II toxin-antitoxin system VapC family toxin [Alphaproteobacteria bacterium]